MMPRDLFERLLLPDPPLVLDVRNADEYGSWKVEGPRPIEMMNVPYFEFIEAEDRTIDEVTRWLAGRARPLVVLCAKGSSSEFVAGVLRDRGIAAENVDGGMIAWGQATAARAIAAPAQVRVWQIHRFGRGCLSYVVAAGQDAMVIDPHRRIDEYRAFLSGQGLALRGVVDTHLHADHVSGAPALAQAEGAPCFGSAADFSGAAFPWEAMEDRKRLGAVGLEVIPVRVLHSPGHTPGSTCLVVNDALLVTGDTLFVGDVGRPDLGGKAADWARELHRTLRERLKALPDEMSILPAHTSGPHELHDDGTIAGRLGDLRARNPSFGLDENEFVRQAEASAGAAPPAYARIRLINLGTQPLLSDELTELELGKNECALHRR